MKKVLLVLLVILAAAAAFVASRPGTYRVERSAVVAAPPETVHSLIADFRRWEAWSPWEKLDPQMKKDFSGAESGTGAIYHWIGNDDVGEGRMTITESDPASGVAIRLEFLKPWQSVNQSRFAFAREDAGTRVTWTMDGTSDFMFKAMSVFMSPDKMMGPDFEKGLASLKELAEASVPAAPDSAAAAPAR